MTISRNAAIESAIDALIEMGFSGPAARDIAAKAEAEASSRRKAAAITAKIKATPYQKWLQQTSPEYTWNKPVHKVLCDNVDDVIAGRTRRLAIFMPPRLGKSEAITVRFPVYFLEANPTARVIIGAYNRDLAKLFTSNSLRIYRARNPDMVASEAQEEWTTKAGGSVLAAGVGSGVTGRGADCLVSGTMVATADGEIAIEHLLDMDNPPDVWTYNAETRTYAFSSLLAGRTIESENIVEVTTDGGPSVTCTSDHLFWVRNKGYVAAHALHSGDELVSGEPLNAYRIVDRVVSVDGSRIVHDIQVGYPHTFFANGLLVHNCIIIDDPVRGYEEAVSVAYQNRVWQWWQNDMRTRVNDIHKTPICLILTRWHELDLAGRILEQDKRRGLWKVISFPALAGENDALGRKPGESIWPERLPAEELEQIKEEMGVRFDALYQQDPTPAEGGLIQEAWFWKSTVGTRKVISEVRAWDLAASVVNRKNSNPDFTAGCRMTLFEGDGKLMYAVRDCARIRAEPGQRDNFIVDTCISDGPECLQIFEENDDGDKTVTHQLRQRLEPFGIQVEGVKPKNDKIVRSTNARSALQRGDMFLVDGRWNYDFVSELVRFPNGRHDDQVDAWSSAYNHLVMRAVRVDIR